MCKVQQVQQTVLCIYSRILLDKKIYIQAVFSSLQNLESCRTLIPHSVPLWNEFIGTVFDGVEMTSFKSLANALLLA